MVLKPSRRGNLYVKGKGVVLVLKPRGAGWVVTVLNEETGRSVGYAWLSTWDLRKLLLTATGVH